MSNDQLHPRRLRRATRHLDGRDRPNAALLECAGAWVVGKWTRSQPIRTAAEIPLEFSLLETRRPFAYQAIAARARQLRRLGMSAASIARALGVTDKTVTKSLLSRGSGA